MKINCPKCSSAAKVDLTRIPDEGGYARCPQCRERIFIRKDGRIGFPPANKNGGTESSEQPASQAGKKETRSSSARSMRRPTSQKPSQAPPPKKKRPPRLLRELDPDAQDEAPAWDPEWEPPLTLGAEHTGVRLRGWFTAFVLTLSLVVGILIYRGLYIRDMEEMDTFLTAQPRAGTEYVKEYTVDDYYTDLRRIRRRIVRGNYTIYTVERYGIEYRVMYDILSACGGKCEYINRVQIIPMATKDGFEAMVDCYEDGKYTVNYQWFSETLSVNNTVCR